MELSEPINLLDTQTQVLQSLLGDPDTLPSDPCSMVSETALEVLQCMKKELDDDTTLTGQQAWALETAARWRDMRVQRLACTILREHHYDLVLLTNDGHEVPISSVLFLVQTSVFPPEMRRELQQPQERPLQVKGASKLGIKTLMTLWGTEEGFERLTLSGMREAFSAADFLGWEPDRHDPTLFNFLIRHFGGGLSIRARNRMVRITVEDGNQCDLEKVRNLAVWLDLIGRPVKARVLNRSEAYPQLQLLTHPETFPITALSIYSHVGSSGSRKRARRIRKALKKNVQLQSVSVHNVGLYSYHSARIIETIMKLGRVRKFKVQGTRLCLGAFSFLRDWLRANTLETLKIRQGCLLGDDKLELAKLLRVLKKNTSLTRLDFSQNPDLELYGPYTGRAIEAWSSMLKHNRTLKFLSLRNQSASAAEKGMILMAIESHNYTLQELDLRETTDFTPNCAWAAERGLTILR